MVSDTSKGVLTFEEKHLIAIMLFLSINGRCRKIDIYQNVSSNPRIPEKLDRLEALGLLIQESDPNHRSIMISLTPKGVEVAEKLADLDKVIKST